MTFDCMDEWLDALEVDLDGLAFEMSGGWFNCLEALQRAGANCVLYATSNKVQKVTRISHRLTGASICLLPSSPIYEWFKKQASKGHAERSGQPSRPRPLRRILDVLTAYTSLPLFKLCSELRRDRCECLVVEQYGTARFDLSVLTARTLSISVFGLFASKSDEGKGYLKLLAYPLRRLSFKMCNGFVVATSAETERVKGLHSLPAQRFAKIPYPIDLAQWRAEDKQQSRHALGLSASDRIVVWHGGVDIWTKGLDVLLAAWRQLKLEDGTGSWKLLIIGGASPEESANMKRMLQQPNTSGVTFVEQWILDRDLLRRYLSASDVYVFPSRSDAFGISALEGAACGCPLVISSGAGAAEIFPDQESSGAIVFENEDSVALAAALHKLLADPKLSAEVGRRARKTVEDCASMDRVGSELLDFLLRSHGKTARQSV